MSARQRIATTTILLEQPWGVSIGIVPPPGAHSYTTIIGVYEGWYNTSISLIDVHLEDLGSF